jgi:hypothetical protein
MTKLFARAFAPVPEEVEHDQRLSEKMGMLQQFIRPEHLDIPPSFQNESSWLACNYPFSLSILILSKKLDSLRGILSSLLTSQGWCFVGFFFAYPKLTEVGFFGMDTPAGTEGASENQHIQSTP